MIRVVLGSLLALSLALGGCAPRVDQDVIAKVDGVTISTVDLQRSLTSYGLEGETVEEVLLSVLEDLINQILIIQQAERMKLTVTPEELRQAEEEIREDYPGDSFAEMLLTQAMDLQEWRRELKNRLLVKKTVAAHVESRLKIDPAEVDKAVAEEQNRDDGDKIKIAQIMTQDKKLAEMSLKEIKSGAPFKEVAAKYSLLAGQAGQETEYFGRGEMPPEMEQAVWSLKPGQASKVVKSEYGWHVFILLDRQSGKVVERRQAVTRLRLSRKAEIEASWLLELRSKAQIKIFPDSLSVLSSALSRRIKNR